MIKKACPAAFYLDSEVAASQTHEPEFNWKN
jgi:hypothetical protein